MKDRKKKAARAWAAALLLLGFTALYPIPGDKASAHHTSAMPYTFQRLGDRTVRGYVVDLLSMVPRAIPSRKPGPKESAEEIHKKLSRYTHRFMVSVHHAKTADPVPRLDVHLTLAQKDWRKRVRMQPTSETGQPAYAANVALGPRGPYDLLVEIRPGPGMPLAAAASFTPEVRLTFAFDYAYERLKDVMQAMAETLASLGNEALTLGLDGEIVGPDRIEDLKAKTIQLRRLAPLVADLRIGAAQELFEEKAGRLVEAVKKAEAAAARGDLDGLVGGIVAARAACVQCHAIFQEADATGGLPKLPPALLHTTGGER